MIYLNLWVVSVVDFYNLYFYWLKVLLSLGMVYIFGIKAQLNHDTRTSCHLSDYCLKSEVSEQRYVSLVSGSFIGDMSMIPGG